MITVALGTAALADERVKDLDERLDMIRAFRGVVGVDRSDFTGFKVTVTVRFAHYITTLGCEYTPGDLPARPRSAA